MHIDVLFLTLRVFSATGGIEKVGRVVCKALSDLSADNQLSRLAVYSMYDEANEANERDAGNDCDRFWFPHQPRPSRVM